MNHWINYKTYQDLSQDVKLLLSKLPDDLDFIVGIPRSGMIPAYMLGFLLNLQVKTLDEFLSIENVKSHSTRSLKSISKIKPKVLIIDDSLDSGNSINKAKTLVKAIENKYDISYAVVYITENNKNLVDFYAQVISQPRVFQWNYLNHRNAINSACYDIDGVLCHDPSEEENDDGVKYIHFIKTAKPLYIPKYKIYALVTSRLEKYRTQTEEWLKEHNVQYEKLYMLNMKTKEERMQAGAHSKFKSLIYDKLKNTNIFYESDFKQAQEISKITHKPVFCVGFDTLFVDGEMIRNEIKVINYQFNKRYPRFLVKVLCCFILSKDKRRKFRQKYMKARQ